MSSTDGVGAETAGDGGGGGADVEVTF